MYKKILVPIALDHDRDADDAVSVARHLLAAGGQIILLSVVEKVPEHVAEYVVIKPADQVVTEIKAKLDDVAKGEPDVTTHVMSGHAAVSINEYADKNGVDLVVITSHRPGLQDYFLGSTAARVVRHAPCAVHVIRRSQ